MRTYSLYLESGPQRKTTLVHVIDLLGCVARGKTTEEAIEAVPEAVRLHLEYLRRHGEKVDPKAPFATRVAEHITKGDFLGQGSPQAVYPPDLVPLTPADLRRYLHRLEWSRADLLALVAGIDDRRLRAKPAKGRAIRDILQHVTEADQGYAYSLLGPVKAVGEPVNAMRRGALDLFVAMRESRAATIDWLAGLSAAERSRVVTRGGAKRSARKTIRRLLEHEWEHRAEIAVRLGRAP